jgi:hypothetical protein
VSVAGFRPGLGRGGITHSLVVTEPGSPGLGDAVDTAGFICSAGANAGVREAGEPADDGVETADIMAVLPSFWVEVIAAGMDSGKIVRRGCSQSTDVPIVSAGRAERCPLRCLENGTSDAHAIKRVDALQTILDDRQGARGYFDG